MTRFLLLLVVGVYAMEAGNACPKNQDAIEYFGKEIPNLAQDLSKITWHHAVNTESLLQEALASDKDMIESDLVHKTIDGKTTAMMGHNPEDAATYTFTFQRFLETFSSHKGGKRKGLKLDFKTTEAFEAAVESNLLSNVSYPVWINADILKGPGGPEARVSLNYAKYQAQIDCHDLSIGWTTGKLPEGGVYSLQDVEEMRLKRFGMSKRTYPVRAAYLAKSWRDFDEVLLKGNEDTLTVWSPADDADIIEFEQLRKVLAENKARIFVDLPENIRQLLGL